MANMEYTETRPAPVESAAPGFGMRAVMQELRRVVWPTREELLRMTAVVIGTVVVVATFIAIVDAILTKAAVIIYGGG